MDLSTAPQTGPAALPLPRLHTLEALLAHVGMSKSNGYLLVRLGQLRARRIGRRWFVTDADARAFLGEPTTT